jgi:hypothetical protein
MADKRLITWSKYGFSPIPPSPSASISSTATAPGKWPLFCGVDLWSASYGLLRKPVAVDPANLALPMEYFVMKRLFLLNHVRNRPMKDGSAGASPYRGMGFRQRTSPVK